MGALLLCVLLVAVVAPVGAAEAPEESWNETFGGAMEDSGQGVTSNGAGGYVGVGLDRYSSTIQGDTLGIRLLNLSSTGATEWSSTIGFGTVGSDVVRTDDGGYLVAGHRFEGSGNVSGIAVKVDADGNTVWSQVYSGSGVDTLNGVVRNGSDGYALVGTTDSYGTAGNSDLWLISTNQTGHERWNATYGGAGETLGRDVTNVPPEATGSVTGNQGFVAVGDQDGDGFYVDVSAQGTPLSSGTVGDGSETDAFESVTFLSSTDRFVFVGTTESYASGQSAGWVVDYEAVTGFLGGGGTMGLNQTYGAGTSTVELQDVTATDDGGYVATGSSENSGQFFDVDSLLLAKFNESNDEVWNTTFGSLFPTENGFGVAQNDSGGYGVIGTRNDSVRDIWMLGTTPERTTSPSTNQRLRGDVTNQSGQPLEGVTVEIIDTDTAQVVDTVTTRTGGNQPGTWGPASYPPGNYTVNVTASDYGRTFASRVRLEPGEAKQITATVNELPNASFSWQPASPIAGQGVTFDASASSDSDGQIATHYWDFTDDGTIDATGTSPSTTHTYGANQTYTVALTVEDDTGDNASTTRQITVGPQSPVDRFDTDNNGSIDTGELQAAIQAFLNQNLSTAGLQAIIQNFLSSGP